MRQIPTGPVGDTFTCFVYEPSNSDVLCHSFHKAGKDILGTDRLIGMDQYGPDIPSGFSQISICLPDGMLRQEFRSRLNDVFPEFESTQRDAEGIKQWATDQKASWEARQSK